MKLVYVYIVIIFLFITGCSTKVSNITETYNSVQMKIDDKEKKYYVLVNKDDLKINSAYSINGILKFRLPGSLDISAPPYSNISLNECLYVKSKKGKEVKLGDSSNKGFKLILLSQYKKLKSQLNNINQKINSTKTAIENYQKNYIQDKNELSYNRAYNNGTCSIPPIKNKPTKPSNVICTSKNECENEGELLCVKVLLGTEACGHLAKQNGYSSFETSALCGLTTASILDQKYDLDDVIHDSMLGALDDYADDKLKNGGFFGKTIGGILKLTTLTRKKQQVEECQQKFMYKYYNAYVNWNNKLYDIEKEPQKLYNSCKNTIERIKNNKQNYFKKKEQLSQLYNKKEEFLEKLKDIKKQKITITPSCR